MTTLTWSARQGHIDVLDICLRAGAKPDVVDSSGKTPIRFAYERGDAEMISRLIAAGANPNVDVSAGLPPLLLYALCSIPHRKDHTAVRAAPLVFFSCGLRDFAHTHRAHAESSYGGLIA